MHKEYTVVFIDSTGEWEMNSVREEFLANHLYDIACENNVQHIPANSESHQLAILKSLGISVKILEEDGSNCTW